MSVSQVDQGDLIGLVLAAGRSRRMGRLKQTLKWGRGGAGDATVVSSAFDVLAPFCSRMFVVVGEDVKPIVAALDARDFAQVASDSEAEMVVSVAAGLTAALQSHPAPIAILMQPGDHPGVAPSTIQMLIGALRAEPLRAHMPEYRGKGGHPALIPVAIATEITRWADLGAGRGSGGLRQFWIAHPHLCRRTPVDDPLCTMDLDTPEDYEHALARCFQP
jgi:CTP:molybdopterin cytidylyltransferase MocA